MTDRSNHYEAAFEARLRSWGVPYVAVDEARRALWAGQSLKSLDFIVSTPWGRNFLVDVKGRRFPGSGGRYWKNWSFAQDLNSLESWERLFGSGFEALLVFAYWVRGERLPVPAESLFEHRGRRYGFVAMRLPEYRLHMRMISPRWGTVEVPPRRFRQLAQPLEVLWEISFPTQAGDSTPLPQGA